MGHSLRVHASTHVCRTSPFTESCRPGNWRDADRRADALHPRSRGDAEQAFLSPEIVKEA